MPASMVKTKRDEKLWTQAKDRAAAEGHEGDWPYVVGIFQRMKRGTAKGAHLPGMLLLPEGYGRRVWGLLKGAGHRYIRRVPIPGKTTKTGKPRYRYYYDVAHGGGIANHEHMVEGASFKHGEGHFHIHKVDGDTLHIKHDETGETHTISKRDLAKKLEGAHAEALKAARDKAAARVKEAEGSGANARQVAKLKEHAARIGAQGGGDREKVVAERHASDAARQFHALQKKIKERENEQIWDGSAFGDPKAASNARAWAQSAHEAGMRNQAMPMLDHNFLGKPAYPNLKKAPTKTKVAAMQLASKAYEDGKDIARMKRERDVLSHGMRSSLENREHDLNAIAPGLADEVRRRMGRSAAKEYLAGTVDKLTAGDIVDSVHHASQLAARPHEEAARLLRAIHDKLGVGAMEAAHHEGRAAEEREAVKRHAERQEASRLENEKAAAKKKADDDAAERAENKLLAEHALASAAPSETAKAAFETAKAKVKTTAPGAFKPAPVKHDRDAAMARAKVFSSTDETRPSLMTTHSTGDGRIVATDGHRLAIIPTSHATRETVSTVNGARDEETFPNYEKVIPQSTKNVATMDAAALRSALEAHIAHAKASAKGAAAHTYLGGSGISSRPQASFEASGGNKMRRKTVTHDFEGVAITPKTEGDFAGVHANTKYLLDAIKGAKGTVRIGTTDQYSPIVIDREDGEKHIIMPLRREAPITKGRLMFGPLSLALASLCKGPEGHTPPEPVRAAARRGLALREKYGKGGLTTQEAGAQGIGSGVARARDLAAGSAVSTKTLKRMVSFFARHRANKSGGEDDAGHVAWLLWGGDPGEAWAKRELAGVEKGAHKYVRREPKAGGGWRYVYPNPTHLDASGTPKQRERHHGEMAKHHEEMAAEHSRAAKFYGDIGKHTKARSHTRAAVEHNTAAAAHWSAFHSRRDRSPTASEDANRASDVAHGETEKAPALAKGAPGNAPAYQAPPGAMRRVVVSGITCHVERMPGEVRHGRIIQNGYGYIPDTLDTDDEPVDCYIGPNALAGLVYVIDQLDEDGDLDEHKVMLGFDSAEDAALAYASCLPRSRMGGMCSVLAGDFIMWLTRNPDLDDEPFWAIAEGSNLRVGRFGAEYQPDAGRALIPSSAQNPA